jgi:catechol 2,3-dioxygenase-like lactoylglutathione lyase family enzyme
VTNTIQITPFMHVRDLEGAIGFMEEVLGFKTVLRIGGDYAYLDREGAGMRVLAYPDAYVFEGGRDRFAYYIDVRDVDALHAELKPKLDALPPEDVHGPADKPYGQRELLVRAPDGQLFAFGQSVQNTTLDR